MKDTATRGEGMIVVSILTAYRSSPLLSSELGAEL